MKQLSKIILEIFGWKLKGELPDIKKSVVVMAPHTSYWDFVIGRLYLNAMGITNNTLIKKEMFFFPLKIIMNFLGAIPVDRKDRKSNMVSQVAAIIKEREECNVFVAAEGTRKKVTRWKKGFYHIAREADVPIVISYIDYKTKEVGIKGTISDTTTIEKTMKEINAFYINVIPKHPELFSLDNSYRDLN